MELIGSLVAVFCYLKFRYTNEMQKDVIQQIAKEVENQFQNEGSGHDWWHIYRVWKLAEHIGQKEGGDRTVISLGALLHEIDDPKVGGNDTPAKKITTLLNKHKIGESVIQSVITIVETISYRNTFSGITADTLEAKIVQDADRLDAIGAIGIARTFMYGGKKGRAMYDPNQPQQTYQSKEDYYTSNSSTINHFYEKLLLLKDTMNTETAKNIAQERHNFMEEYLERFYQEWEGRA